MSVPAPDTEMTRHCPECDRRYPAAFAFCPDDGTDLVPDEAQATPGKLPGRKGALWGLLGLAVLGTASLVSYTKPHAHSQSPPVSIPMANNPPPAPETRSVNPSSPLAAPERPLTSYTAVRSGEPALSISGYRLTESDLQGKSDQEMTLMRNEIYARHGYRFIHPELLHYFQQKPWYRPDSSDQNAVMHRMSLTERVNANFILAYQKKFVQAWTKRWTDPDAFLDAPAMPVGLTALRRYTSAGTRASPTSRKAYARRSNNWNERKRME